MFDNWLALNRVDGKLYVWRGTLLLATRAYQSALEDFDKATLFQPNMPAAWIGRANALLELSTQDETDPGQSNNNKHAEDAGATSGVGRRRRCPKR